MGMHRVKNVDIYIIIDFCLLVL